jgi:predicted Zn-dependent peptidase
MLGNRLSEAIPLLGAYLLSPLLPEEHISPCKSLCLQSIQSLADNPSHLAAVELNSNHLPAPYNRSAYGQIDCIESATIEQLRDVYRKLFIPNDSILVIAGEVDHEHVVEKIERLVEEWEIGTELLVSSSPSQRGVHWVEQDSSQVHLSFAFDGPNATDDNSILESIAISIFGGATSGRLFTQVRQRRSLCYSVSAQYAAAKERSTVRMHAGTTPERAEETAQVCLEQLSELKKGITKEEFTRTIQRMKSRTVMHGESTTARASALWGDQYALGKARSLEERLQEIDDVQFDAVNSWLDQRDFGQLTCVAVGPSDIQFNSPTLQL